MRDSVNAYRPRLKIPAEGHPTLVLFTPAGLQVGVGYRRVVFGGRGPYIEFTTDQVLSANLHIPPDEHYRLGHPAVFYVEYRSNCEASVMFYFQKRSVDYADYIPGLWYATPFQLHDSSGRVVIGHPLGAQRTLFDATG